MAGNRSSTGNATGTARFRVSDSFAIPLRGHMLRLRLVAGRPSIKDLSPGKKLRLEGPVGRERTVTIADHSVIGGRQTQQRLEQTRELDIVISAHDAGTGAEQVVIGWFAGPAGG